MNDDAKVEPTNEVSDKTPAAEIKTEVSQSEAAKQVKQLIK